MHTHEADLHNGSWMGLYNITHAVDIDGMSSAAFLVRYRGMPLENIIFSNYNESRFARMERTVSELRPSGSLIVLSDLNVNAPMLHRYVKMLSHLRRMGNKIVWLDHHPWGDAPVKAISPLCDLIVEGENRERCGAELVYKFLCERDRFGDRLADFAHTADFARPFKSMAQGRRIIRFSQVIKYFNVLGQDRGDSMLRRVVSCLATGDYSSKFIALAQGRYNGIMTRKTQELLGSTRMFRAGGISVAVGFSSKISGSMGCSAMMEKFRPDMALYVDYDPLEFSGNIRSTEGVDCSILARKLGGGGHPHAAGFSIKRGSYSFSSERSREAFTRKVLKVAERIYA